MRKIFAVNEVIRYSIYVFIISQISQTHSQFDVTPFESHIDDNQAKDPYQSTVYYSDQDLNSTDNNLQSIYQQTENLLYNESSTEPIDQIYPSIQQQNVSDWFTQLLKNSQAGSAAQYFNFSKLSPQLNFSNDSFYKLPINFKVFPDSENITVLNTTLPSDVRKVDAKSIFKDASGFTPYLNNKNEIYSTAPLIDSLAMNKVNNTGILSKFFQSFKNTSKPSISFPSIPNGGQSKPNRPIPNTSTLPADILAKKIAEDGGKNSSKYLGNILGHLGLQDVKTVGNGQPMDLYRLHGNDEHQEFNRSSVDHIPSMFPPTFLSPSQLPPARNTLSNQTNTWVFPLANQTTTVTPNISTITTQPTTVNNSSSQNVLTPPTINSSTTNSTNSSVTNSSTPRINPSFSATATDSLSDVYGEIVYSIVYFVHGSHTPISSYFKDIVNNINYWPEGMNRLTNAGKNEMYQLGKWFRQRYRELTGYYYNASLVTVESGGSDLTLSSAEVMAAGLFPPVGYQVWNQAIRWQPIPVYSIPVESDNVILMTKSCKQYGLQVKDLHTSTEWQQFYDDNTDTFNYLNENIGSNFTKGDILGDLERILNIYEDLQTEENRGLPLPNWTETIYPDQLRSLAGKYIDFAVETRQLQKIKTGPFFQRIIEIMSKKINSSNSTSQFPEILHFYSGNTFGLGSIMKTLGLYNSSIPPYASALIFDLRYKDDEYVITVSYKNSSNDAPNLLIIPDCQPTCWFNDFISITKDLMSNNWDDDCATITLSDLTYTIPILIFGVVIIFILALIVVLLCVKCCKYIRGSKANFG